MTAHKIRANSVLPARREPLTLETADGLQLVAELALPLERPPVATIVCLHPLPTHGGMMDSHIYRKAAFRLPALADIAILRFNTRGTWSVQGRSEGEFDNAVGEKYDVAAALEYAEFHDLPNIWLVGWSFGTDLALVHGLDPAVQGMILLSPPLRYSRPEHLAAWAASGKPVSALIPEHDDYLQPPEAIERFAAIPQAEVVPFERSKHLWGRGRREGARRDRQPRHTGGGHPAADRVGGAHGDRRHQRLQRPQPVGVQGRAGAENPKAPDRSGPDHADGPGGPGRRPPLRGCCTPCCRSAANGCGRGQHQYLAVLVRADVELRHPLARITSISAIAASTAIRVASGWSARRRAGASPSSSCRTKPPASPRPRRASRSRS